MLPGIDKKLALLVLSLESKVNAFKRLRFQLIDLVIQHLKPCDVDHTVVVW